MDKIPKGNVKINLHVSSIKSSKVVLPRQFLVTNVTWIFNS